MGLQIGKGFTLNPNFEFGARNSTVYHFTIQNYLWQVIYKNKDPNTFTSSYTTLDLVQQTDIGPQYRHLRDDGYYMVFLFPNRDRSVPFQRRQYLLRVLKDDSDPLDGYTPSCLIDVDVQIFQDGYREFIIYNRQNRYYHSSLYFKEIINNIIDQYYT